jgi:hypothetical protein
MMMGSMDLDYCVFNNIGLWIEINIMANTSVKDNITIPLGGKKSKDIAQNIFEQQIFKREEFSAVHMDPLGLQSICKNAATNLRRCGVTKDRKI